MKGTRPKFRDNLVAQPIEDAGIQYVEVSDPHSGASFRFYDFEYAVAYLMDGVRSVNQISTSARSELGFDTTPEDVTGFVQQLIELGYVTAVKSLEPEAEPARMPGAEVSIAPANRRGDESSFEGLMEDTKTGTRALPPLPLTGNVPMAALASPPSPQAVPAPAPVELSNPEIILEPDEPTAVGSSAAAEKVAEKAAEKAVEKAPPLPPPPPRTPDPEVAVTLKPPVPATPASSAGAERVVLGKPPARAPAPVPVVAKPEISPAAESAEPKKSNALLYFMLLLALAGGAAVFYWKVLKKPAESSTTPVGVNTPVDDTAPVPSPANAAITTAVAQARTNLETHPEAATLAAPYGAPVPAVAKEAGRIQWLAKNGVQVVTGTPVAKLMGAGPIEAKVKDRELSLAGHRKKLDEYKAKQPPNPAKVTFEEKEVERVNAEVVAAKERLAALVILAPADGELKLLVALGDEVAVAKPVAQVGGGSTNLHATFLLKGGIVKAGDPCTLDVVGSAVPCAIVSPKAGPGGAAPKPGGDGILRVLVEIPPDAANKPAPGTQVKLVKAGAAAPEAAPMVTIPASALRGGGDATYVLVVKDGKAVQQVVKAHAEGAEAVVETGVAVGDRVVLGEAKEGDTIP